MTGPGRDWDKELAKIDKVMERAPALPPPSPPARAPSAAPPTAPPSRGGGALSTWFKVLLGVVLAGAMTQWPYGAKCGMPLFFYAGATGIVVLTGLWAGVATWRRRMGFAHVLSLLISLWGAALLAMVILPRIGYAKVGATWWCG